MFQTSTRPRKKTQLILSSSHLLYFARARAINLTVAAGFAKGLLSVTNNGLLAVGFVHLSVMGKGYKRKPLYHHHSNGE